VRTLHKLWISIVWHPGTTSTEFEIPKVDPAARSNPWPQMRRLRWRISVVSI
jgi:hypothetical protein